jgi:hypothetical protein
MNIKGGKDHKNRTTKYNTIYKVRYNNYVGESKIIRTIGTCFAVGYIAGWA